MSALHACDVCGTSWDAPVDGCPQCQDDAAKSRDWRTPAMLFDDALQQFTADARQAFANAEVFGPNADTDTLSLAELIHSQRMALGLSLDEFGKRAGFAKSHAWELEQGRSANPTVRMVQRIASALGLPSTLVFRAALKVTEAQS